MNVWGWLIGWLGVPRMTAVPPSRYVPVGPVPPPVVSGPPDPTADPNATTNSLVVAHNNERAAVGLPALTHDARLTIQVSRRFALEIAYRDVLTHDRLSGKTDEDEIAAALGRVPADSGENAAAGQTTVAEVMVDWMGSPGHRADILDPNYTLIGAGVARSASGTLYWIADFARP